MTTGTICTISYSAALDDARRRIQQWGERQTFCPTCKKWLWPDQDCGDGVPRWIYPQFKYWARQQGVVLDW